MTTISNGRLALTVLLASTYGFTVARAVFATSGPAWIDDHVLTLPTAVIGVGLFVASLALARWAGAGVLDWGSVSGWRAQRPGAG